MRRCPACGLNKYNEAKLSSLIDSGAITERSEVSLCNACMDDLKKVVFYLGLSPNTVAAKDRIEDIIKTLSFPRS